VYIPAKTSPAEPALSLSKGTTENAPGRYPDFLCSLVQPRNLVRLSVKKAAYADLSRVACRKSGSVLGELDRTRMLTANHPKPTRFSLRFTRFHAINGLPARQTPFITNLDSSG
jgi:hypothetical protein